MAYRSEFFEQVAQGRSVLGIALDIHSRVCGSMERGPDELIRRDVQALREVIDNWIVSQRAFDTCVLNLLIEAVAEAQREGLA